MQFAHDALRSHSMVLDVPASSPPPAQIRLDGFARRCRALRLSRKSDVSPPG
jgi:hypothetical protein